jgi:hypothetical protein
MSRTDEQDDGAEWKAGLRRPSRPIPGAANRVRYLESTRPPVVLRPCPLSCPRCRSLATLVLASLLSALVLPASASSPAAWRDYGQKVQSRCLAASTLKGARPMGERLDLPAPTPDGSLISALMLTGLAPQAFRQGVRLRELCLYDQRSGQARVAEADDLLAPRKP